MIVGIVEFGMKKGTERASEHVKVDVQTPKVLLRDTQSFLA